MDNCFAACGCENHDGVTKSDLDRFTDCIENVLSDEKGRKLFRVFMHTSKLKAGRHKLDVWEHSERLLAYKENAESVSYRRFLRDIEKLIDDADKIEDLDLATMQKLTNALDLENKEDIMQALQLLKLKATETLRREYNAFRKHYVPG